MKKIKIKKQTTSPPLPFPLSLVASFGCHLHASPICVSRAVCCSSCCPSSRNSMLVSFRVSLPKLSWVFPLRPFPDSFELDNYHDSERNVNMCHDVVRPPNPIPFPPAGSKFIPGLDLASYPSLLES